MEAMEKELRKNIAMYTDTPGHVDNILTLIKEAGYRLPPELPVLSDNPYLLKDTDGDYYNKYPEFEVYEQGKLAQRDADQRIVEGKDA